MISFLALDAQPKKAIVIGASSGMGRQLAKLLAHEYEVGLVARRIDLLQSLQTEIKAKTYIKQMDITADDAQKKLAGFIEEMGGLDLMVITAGSFMDVGAQTTLDAYKTMIDVDATGFVAVAEVAIAQFKHQGYGHLVGFSSIDALRGSANYSVYSAVKAFVHTYLEGKRNYMSQNNIPVAVTEIIPGWVNNERIDYTNVPDTYWVATAEDAALQIYDAIKAHTKEAYITKRWRIIAWLMKWLPDCIYNRIGGL